MGVAADFQSLCNELTISSARRSKISERYELMTRRLNLEYWNSDSRSQHSLYAGSYGRGTATSRTSDVDMIFWLPYAQYSRFSGHSGNGQSAMLHEVSKAIQQTYPVTKIGADGQVVVVPFDDGIVFEVLPAFANEGGSFTYADTNGGGTWKTTNPRPEIEEIARLDKLCNGNLKTLAKMARAWKHVWSVDISGLLIDTLVYQFIRDYEYRDKSFLYYDYMSRDFFDFLSKQSADQSYWLSPGACQYVWKKGNFQFKAAQCRNLASAACVYQGDAYGWTARQKWREIYGTKFPSA